MRQSRTFKLFVTGIVMLAGMTQANAQGPQEFKIRSLTVDLVDAPTIQSSGGGTVRVPKPASGSTNKWLRIETQFDSSTRLDWVDDVKVEYFVLGADLEARKPILISGEETFINVQRGRGHFVVIYAHPSVVKRYLNSQLPTQVTVLLHYQGRPVDSESKPAATLRWWEKLTPQAGLLLSRNQTPWAALDNDRYEFSRTTP